MMRKCTRKAISFAAWCHKNGHQAMSEAEEATYIGQTIFPQQRTRRQKGLEKSLADKYKRTQELHAQYEREVPTITYEVPLGDNAADQAYIRAMERRKKALDSINVPKT